LTVSGPQSALQMFHSDPLIRKIAIENMVSFVGGGVALLSLAKLSGAADVSLEPGPDFGKMRIGNLRLNIFGSDQVIARTIYEIATRKRVDYLTGVSRIGRGESIVRFLRGRLSPEGSLIADIAAGKNYLGEEMKWDPKTFWREAPQRLIPLAAQDIYDTWNRQGPLAAIATAPLTALGLPTSAYETAGQQLANAYNDKVEQGEFGPNAKPYKDETPTTRKFNIAQDEDLQKADASRNIASRKEIDGDKMGLEQEYHLPDAARRILSGEDALGPQFLKDFEEYQTKMQGIYFDKYFSFDPSNDSAEEKALQVYRDISPNDPKYRDPATNEPLWDDFFEAKDAALANLSPELQRALKESLKSLDPDVQRVETQLKQAKDVVGKFYDTPKYKGLNLEQGEAVDKVLNEIVPQIQLTALRQGIELKRSDAVRYAIRQGLVDGEAAVWLRRRFRRTRRKSESRRTRRREEDIQNPARDLILLENQELLSRFFPDLLQRQLTREQEAELGQSAFAAVSR